jgi:hypothetical protein
VKGAGLLMVAVGGLLVGGLPVTVPLDEPLGFGMPALWLLVVELLLTVEIDVEGLFEVETPAVELALGLLVLELRLTVETDVEGLVEFETAAVDGLGGVTLKLSLAPQQPVSVQ